MNKEYQKAYKEAQNKIREQKTHELVCIIQNIFEVIDKQNANIARAMSILKICEQDLKDLKAGKVKEIKKRTEEGTTSISRESLNKLELLTSDSALMTNALNTSYSTSSGNTYTIVGTTAIQ